MRKYLMLSCFFIGYHFTNGQIPEDGLLVAYDFDLGNEDLISSVEGSLLGGAYIDDALYIGMNDSDGFAIPGTLVESQSEFTISFDVYFEEFNTNHASACNVLFSGANSMNDNLLNFAYAKGQLSGGSATLENTFFYVHDNVRYEFNDISLLESVWYNVTLVRSSNRLYFYLNGVLMSPTNGLIVPNMDLTLHEDGFVFGQDQDVLGGGFQDFQSLNGRMDDLLVYNRALSEREVIGLNHCDGIILDVQTVYNSVAKPSLEITVYPNPVSDYMNIAGLPDDFTGTVEFYNVEGKLLMSETTIPKRINIRTLKPGNYFLIIKGEELLSKHHIVKN